MAVFASHSKDAKMLAFSETIFSKKVTRMMSSNLKNASEMTVSRKFHFFSLQNSSIIFGDVKRNFEKDGVT